MNVGIPTLKLRESGQKLRLIAARLKDPPSNRFGRGLPSITSLPTRRRALTDGRLVDRAPCGRRGRATAEIVVRLTV